MLGSRQGLDCRVVDSTASFGGSKMGHSRLTADNSRMVHSRDNITVCNQASLPLVCKIRLEILLRSFQNTNFNYTPFLILTKLFYSFLVKKVNDKPTSGDSFPSPIHGSVSMCCSCYSFTDYCQ
jgi:hypothetical protein